MTGSFKHMKRLLFFTWVGALAGCNAGTEGGLLVAVSISPAVKTNCIALEIQKVGEGTVMASAVVARPAGAQPVQFAVRQAELPAQVQAQAVGYSGVQCDDALTRKLASRGEVKTFTFTKNKIEKVSLALGPPDERLDADRDGVVAIAQGGIDCDDANANAYPGAIQACDSPADLNCDGAVSCADVACATSAVCMRPPDRLAFVSEAPTGVTRFDCSPAIVIESQDALGPAAVSKRETLTLTGSLAGTEFFADATCQTLISAPVIEYGTTRATLFMKVSSFGLQTLTVASTGLSGAMQRFIVAPQPATHFAFMPSMLSVTAGDCAEATLLTTDTQMRPTPSQSPVTASLSALPASGTRFYAASDTNCTTPITTMLFTGLERLNFRLKSTRATSSPALLTVTAEASTVRNPGQMMVTVRPAAAAQLAFLTQAPGLVVDTCSGPVVRVGVQDAYGNPTTVPSDTIVSFTSAASASFTFSSDAACANPQPTLQATIPANSGASNALAIKSNSVGVVKMTVTGPTLSPGTQFASIAKGPPVSIAMTSAPITALAGLCSPQPMVIETRDSTNARSSVQGMNLSVEVSGTGLTFYSDLSCTKPLSANTLTIPVGSAEGSVYFVGKTAPITVDVVAVAPSYLPPGNSATQRATIDPDKVYALVWAGNTSQSVVAGDCTAGPFTLELHDKVGNLTTFGSTQVVTLTSSPPGVTASARANCDASTITFSSAASQVQLYAKQTMARSYALTASAGGFTSSLPAATLNITSAPYSSLVFTVPSSLPPTITAGACQQVTVERRDTFGNAAPVTAATNFTLSSTATGLTAYATLADCQSTTAAVTTVAVSSGATATFWVRPTLVQATTIAVTSSGISTVTGAMSVVPAAPTDLVWLAPAGGVATIASGGCVTMTLERRDPFGNAAPDATALPIALGAAGSAASTAKLWSANTCTGSLITSVSLTAGMSRVSFGATTNTAGTLTVTPESTLNDGVATITVTPGAASALVYTASPGSTAITAGDCTQLTVERRDPGGNAVPFTGSFTISGAGLTAYATNAHCLAGTPAITALAVTNSASGTFFVRPTVAPSVSVSISDGTRTAMTTVQVQAAPTASINWASGLPAAATAGACVMLTLERRDAFGNLASAGATSLSIAASGTASSPASLSSATNCSSAVPSPLTVVIADGQTSKSFSVSTTLVGTLTLTPSGLPGAGAHDLTVGPAAPATLVLSAIPASTVAGTCTSNSLEVRDQYNNRARPVGGLAVTVSASAGGATFFASLGACPNTTTTTVTIPSDGTPRGFAFRPLTVPSVTLQATATGVTSATQMWSVTAGPAAALNWQTKPPSSLMRFSCATGVLRAEDAFGNPVNSPTAPASRTLSLASSAAGVGIWFSSAVDCSTGPVTSIGFSANSPSTTVGLIAIGSGSTNLTATDNTASGLGATPGAAVSIAGSQGALLVEYGTTSSIEYFDCEPIIIRRQFSSINWAKGVTPLSISSDSASISLHGDANCTTALASPSIGDGSATTTVYVKGHSSNSAQVTLTASDTSGGFANGTAQVTALPLVRRGTCSIAASTASISCPISPAIPGADLSHTFMVFQASVDAAAPADATVRCVLTNTSAITCSRAGAGSTSPVGITWQTVSMGRGPSAAYSGGLLVQHLSGTAVNMAATAEVALTPPVTLSRSFVLLSTSTTGTVIDHDDFITGKLTSSSMLTLTSSFNFSAQNVSWAAQVVELDGAVVDRNTGTAGAVASFTQNTASLPQSFVLATIRYDAAGDNTDVMCKRSWRIQTTSATQLTFTRSTGGHCSDTSVAEAAWERIGVPAGGTVQTCELQISNNAAPTGTCTLGVATALDRTLLLLGQQGPAGQALGMSGRNTDSNVGYGSAGLTLSGTTVTATRAVTSTTAGDFAPLVIEFAP